MALRAPVLRRGHTTNRRWLTALQPNAARATRSATFRMRTCHRYGDVRLQAFRLLSAKMINTRARRYPIACAAIAACPGPLKNERGVGHQKVIRESREVG